jgi:hypothetical protein
MYLTNHDYIYRILAHKYNNMKAARLSVLKKNKHYNSLKQLCLYIFIISIVKIFTIDIN